MQLSLHPCANHITIFCIFFIGEYHCPVLNKVFTEFTHIVSVKTTGNVFCYEVALFIFCLFIYCP
jgi:hypothetical protein